MSCTRGKASPNRFTQFKLFANSGGYCQNSSCNEKLYKSFEAGEIHIAEIAHIISVMTTWFFYAQIVILR